MLIENCEIIVKLNINIRLNTYRKIRNVALPTKWIKISSKMKTEIINKLWKIIKIIIKQNKKISNLN